MAVHAFWEGLRDRGVAALVATQTMNSAGSWVDRRGSHRREVEEDLKQTAFENLSKGTVGALPETPAFRIIGCTAPNPLGSAISRNNLPTPTQAIRNIYLQRQKETQEEEEKKLR